MVSPEKVNAETVVRIETQPGWGGVDGSVLVPEAGVGAGVASGVTASVGVVVWKGRMVMVGMLEVGRLDAERVMVVVVARTKEVVVVRTEDVVVS
jgi:hypothetical protein